MSDPQIIEITAVTAKGKKVKVEAFNYTITRSEDKEKIAFAGSFILAEKLKNQEFDIIAVWSDAKLTHLIGCEVFPFVGKKVPKTLKKEERYLFEFKSFSNREENAS